MSTQEEEYEWGNPKAKSKLPSDDLDAKANSLAMVNHQRRMDLQLRSKEENRPIGIFSGFRAIIHQANTNKKNGFKRLLEAGGGVVVDLK